VKKRKTRNPARKRDASEGDTPPQSPVGSVSHEVPEFLPPHGGYLPVESEAPFHRVPTWDAPMVFAREIREAIEMRGIAPIAAQLLAASPVASEMDEIGAIRVALRLLEAEQYVLAALREEKGAESGLAKWREAWQARERDQQDLASAIRYEFRTDEHGKLLPVPIEEALEVLMPGLKNDPEARRKRFLQWVSESPAWRLRSEMAALNRQADDERLENRKRVEAIGLRLSRQFELSQLLQDPKKLLTEAEKRLTEMREHGIPAVEFELALREFKLWWKEKLSEVRSVSGKEARKKQLAQARR
jgi:hypothetical protein